MLEIASQIILCLILAAILGFIIGYLLGRICSTSEKKNTTGVSIGSKPKFLLSPRRGGKDNLSKIKGIGVKIEGILNDLGIYHFDQIASWNKEETSWIDNNVAFPGRVQREQWVEQAKVLATGRETDFSKRVTAGEVSSSKKS
ncbi:MAG: NADH-ubiquinone oxidoreductase chain E (EC [uncultured Campylobacterales bacterium]|uniref:NADH-ubiquinone oxidoreductase chain E (EC) n=1 Tax=uncultured Campylobacterales bacterium TaxID=352960 RepID=A0A6S6SJ69_9BACT|nr:MAG: NADH-ubiquinone oxidoreductase chain E (EC [uncultured Campylobacterales bacterium]